MTRHVPEQNHPIARSRNCKTPIFAELNIVNLAAVSEQNFALPCCHIPEEQSPVTCARRSAKSIGANGNCENSRRAVPFKAADFLPCLDIPEYHQTIVRTCQQLTAI